VKRSALQRYRMAIRDGADPNPFDTMMAHRNDQKVVVRSPSTVYGGQFRDSNPDTPWSQAWEQMRNVPDRPEYLDVDEAYAGFNRYR
jgi:hypothetical protein